LAFRWYHVIYSVSIRESGSKEVEEGESYISARLPIAQR